MKVVLEDEAVRTSRSLNAVRAVAVSCALAAAGGACGSVGDICRCRAQSHCSPSDSWASHIDLSATELALLEALLERPGAILSCSQLEQRLYGWNEEVESNAVEVHVSRLRKKIGADLIGTVRGVGYRVVKPA